MVSRTVRTPFGDWWWTVDRAVLAAMFGLMLGGIILSLAASPPVARGSTSMPFISSTATSYFWRRPCGAV